MFNNPDPDRSGRLHVQPASGGWLIRPIDSDGPMSDPVVLASGEFDPTIDAGLFRKGSIHVFGYLDEDGDGNFDTEDGALSRTIRARRSSCWTRTAT